MTGTTTLAALLMYAVLLLAPTHADAQTSGVRRTIVEKGDVSVPNREAVVARIELDPTQFAGRHVHSGDEIAYVIEGGGELLVDGEPTRQFKAGDAFIVAAGKIHDARNTGTVPLKLIGVYVVEKGKPLATPAK